jgi:DNA (cytosine-5)-methyltransferase 1
MAHALGWGTPDRPYPTIAAGTAAGGADADMIGGSGARAALTKARHAPTWVRLVAVNDRPNNAIRTADKPAPTLAFGHEHPRWVYDRPATTIVGSFQPQIVAAPNYRTTGPRQDQPDSVRVTVAEAGILQSFPHDYPWQGSRTARFQQVGNAIPPLMAKAVVETLLAL